MITLELHYAKDMHYLGEETQYKTWHWIDGEWHKVPVPKFSCGETAGSSVDKSKVMEAEEWFKTSNREDLIFLEKEKMACQYWYDAEKKEVTVAQDILS